VLPSIKATGKPDLGWIGVDAQAVTPRSQRPRYDRADRRNHQGGDQERTGRQAGLKKGDVIVELEGKKILDAGELPERWSPVGHIGKTVTFKVIRQGKTLEIKALVEKRPDK